MTTGYTLRWHRGPGGCERLRPGTGLSSLHLHLPAGVPFGSPPSAVRPPVRSSRSRIDAASQRAAFGGRSSGCPGPCGVSLYGGAACSKVGSKRPPPRSRSLLNATPILRHAAISARIRLDERHLDNPPARGAAGTARRRSEQYAVAVARKRAGSDGMSARGGREWTGGAPDCGTTGYVRR